VRRHRKPRFFQAGFLPDPQLCRRYLEEKPFSGMAGLRARQSGQVSQLVLRPFFGFTAAPGAARAASGMAGGGEGWRGLLVCSLRVTSADCGAAVCFSAAAFTLVPAADGALFLRAALGVALGVALAGAEGAVGRFFEVAGIADPRDLAISFGFAGRFRAVRAGDAAEAEGARAPIPVPIMKGFASAAARFSTCAVRRLLSTM